MLNRLMLVAILILGSRMARAYEYPLQFTPPGGARGVTVAGYSISGQTVTGNCSYYTSIASGGRGGRTIITHYYQKCTWDIYGNLTSMVPLNSPLPTPRLVATSGYENIYASIGISKTGVDTRGFGFVNTPSAHYSWETPNGAYSVIADTEYVFTVNLVSDGDVRLYIDRATVEAAISGTVTATAGMAKIVGTSCDGFLYAKSVCSVTVSYNPATIACTTSPYGYAYTVLDLGLISDSGANPAFKHGFTIMGVPVCNV